ncbi:DNA adenine methylase [Clostridium sp. KNHs216]|uniref:DNA adenine methylase n=1 Tax=Clostridium sp. KNHs216 TaxID=1550235 RepID=UPI001153611A|nr:DNA adenine methylase [Clostridium sp. KNHs216]TQI66241.1 DNA adenine methylase [Clostridium sp. KNHs216]
MQQLRTVVKYPGAKWRLSDWIISHMPEHKSYLEPYFGSGAVFFRKAPAKIETINDIDEDVVNLFRCIREDAEKLAMLVETTPYAREEYYSAFTESPEEPYERARLFLMKTWMGHGFRTYCRSGWKNDIAGRENSYAVNYWNRLPEWIMNIVARLKEVQIECKPAPELIERFNRPNVLIYADPPYLLSTRKMKKQYAYEMTDADHVELLTVLKQHQGPVLLSGYDNELYNDMLQGWQKDQIITTAEKGKHRTETLWIKE